MTLDRKKYPMLADPSNPPACKECDGRMVRVEALGDVFWMCLDWDCDAMVETDAGLDNRLTSAAEAAFERQQSGSGAGFLSPDALQRSLKR